MSASPHDLAPFDPWRRSLRQSRARRAAARRRVRWQVRRRGVGLLLATTMTIGAAGALAADGGTGQDMLTRGSEGAAVVALQHALGVQETGTFGPQTARAVRAFQREQGLEVDGIVGPQTAEALGLTDTAGEEVATGDGAPSARLERIAACESGGDPTAISRDGLYRGKYQFDRATWRSLGGRGDPAAAPEAEQDRRAAALLEREGGTPWPNCA